MHPHAAMHATHAPGVQAGDRVAFKTKPTFVDSVWEVLGPLLAGATLAAVPQAVMRDPGQASTGRRLLRDSVPCSKWQAACWKEPVSCTDPPRLPVLPVCSCSRPWLSSASRTWQRCPRCGGRWRPACASSPAPRLP